VPGTLPNLPLAITLAAIAKSQPPVRPRLSPRLALFLDSGRAGLPPRRILPRFPPRLVGRGGMGAAVCVLLE